MESLITLVNNSLFPAAAFLVMAYVMNTSLNQLTEAVTEMREVVVAMKEITIAYHNQTEKKEDAA